MAENSSLPPASRPLARDRSRDKALLVGIQYNNPASDEVSPLHYPHRDMKIFKRYLEEHEGYNADNIVVLMDRENESEDTLPTKANIVSLFLCIPNTALTQFFLLLALQNRWTRQGYTGRRSIDFCL